jgi:hypothetical protein
VDLFILVVVLFSPLALNAMAWWRFTQPTGLSVALPRWRARIGIAGLAANTIAVLMPCAAIVDNIFTRAGEPFFPEVSREPFIVAPFVLAVACGFCGLFSPKGIRLWLIAAAISTAGQWVFAMGGVGVL